MSQQGLISEHTWQRLSPVMERQNDVLVAAVKQVVTSDPAVEAEELDTAHREALRAQRSALTGLLRDGVISEETYSQLVGEVDAALTEQHYNWPDLLRAGTAPSSVNRLMTAIIQEVDLENALASLSKLGFSVARLSSTGGFLSRKNVTLLVGIQEGREEAAVKALKNSCKRRLEFVSSPVRGSAFPLPSPLQVSVGGATVFLLKALLDAGYRVTRIASTGGFLRRGTATLLMGIDKSRVQTAMQIIRENSAPAIDPGLKRAHVFVLKVDRFEQLNQGNLS